VLLQDGRHETATAEITVEGGDGAWGTAGGLDARAGAEGLIESAASLIGSANVRLNIDIRCSPPRPGYEF